MAMEKDIYITLIRSHIHIVISQLRMVKYRYEYIAAWMFWLFLLTDSNGGISEGKAGFIVFGSFSNSN